MADRVLEHDPDAGCVRCPCSEWWPHTETAFAFRTCAATIPERKVPGGPAPAWCPLREGRVVVQAPKRG